MLFGGGAEVFPLRPIFFSLAKLELRECFRPVRTAHHDISNAFAHRHLLRGFIVHEISGRYAASAGGLLWSVIHPAVQIVIFYFLFQYLFRVRLMEGECGTSSFLLFFLSAFFPWLMISDALERSSQSLVRNSSLVTKVVFPCELLPMSSVIVSHLLNGLGFLLLIFYLLSQGKVASAWLLLPLVVGLQMLFTLGLSYLLAALVVFVRDIQEVFRIFLNLWFYATPILYPASSLPESLRFWLSLNPLTPLVDAYRACLLRLAYPWRSLIVLALWASITYGVGSWFFHRSKRAFADVL